jgi:hypothetical protein
MNSPEYILAGTAPSLAGLAFALLATGHGEDSAEAKWLNGWRAQLPGGDPAAAGDLWRQWAAAPPAADRRLHALGSHLQLGVTELLAVALAAATELDLLAGRALAWLQTPTGGARPTAGLVASLAQTLDGGDIALHLAQLASGTARSTGLLQPEADNRPLPETGFRVPQALVLALAGIRSHWPGLPMERAGENEPPLPPSLHEAARHYAQALSAGSAMEPAALAIRCGHPKEARAIAQIVAQALGCDAAFLDSDPTPGLGPWLWLNKRMPAFCAELAPGEKRVIPALPGYGGPVLIAAGPDGAFEWQGAPVTNWRVPVPAAAERIALWHAATGDAQLSQELGTTFRHASGRIHDLAAAGRFQSALAGEPMPDAGAIAAAARCGAAVDLGALAELLPETIDEAAVVLPPQLKVDLNNLVRRCSGRDTLAETLGPATRARHRPGVRALFHGPSGTGKSLAVGWLATRLGQPLYRIDLASVTSKYIGETEKNLAQLFARAEHAEVILMFDEADSLFGKRTEVKDANDRYANQQTNYLLQRIETFEGIVVLTSNSRSRFDSAFTRRLDAIIEFPMPAPEERRALWLAHLGTHHSLEVAQINRIAATCDLAGGHIRNATLAAASLSPGGINYAALRSAIEGEYRKLGRQMPAGL